MYAAAAAALAWALYAGYSSIWQRGYSAHETATNLQAMRAERTAAIAALAREAEVRAVETAMAARVHAVAERYEQERIRAAETADLVAADLRAGNLRLRDAWRGCAAAAGAALPGDSAAAVVADAGADDREASAGRVIGAGAECDAQVIGLQNYIRSILPALHPQ